MSAVWVPEMPMTAPHINTVNLRFGGVTLIVETTDPLSYDAWTVLGDAVLRARQLAEVIDADRRRPARVVEP